MYEFVDTIERASAAASLPAEALQINGEYIENLIGGYRTLSVSGREMLNAEITEQEIDTVDGSEYLYRRYPARDIVVRYQIIASSASNLQQKFNALNKILDVENATLIFKDEPDKYFVGTCSDIDLPEEGRLVTTGKFTLHCSDPFKHSSVKKEFTAAANEDGVLEMTIVNDGSVSVPIDYEITHNHENGYIGIVSEHGAIELGRIDEDDDAMANKSAMLVNFTKYSDFDAMTTGSGVTSETTYGKTGTFKEVSYNGRSWISLNSLGSGSYYRGACKTMTIPADENGDVGAVNFKAQCRVDYETVKRLRQTGMLQFVIGDENGDVLALIYFNKNTKTSNTAQYRCRVGKQDKNKISFTPNYQNLTTKAGNLISITKTGGLFEFNVCGKKYQFRDDSLASKMAKSITIFMGNMPGAVESFMSTSTNLGRMLLTDLTFRKDNVTYTYDVPNRYPEGSVIKVDGESTKVYVDDVVSLGDEVLGSKYFLAPPGNTTVRFFHSEFSDPVPTVKAYIREAYI